MPLIFCPTCGEVDSFDPTLDADMVGVIPCFACTCPTTPDVTPTPRKDVPPLA